MFPFMVNDTMVQMVAPVVLKTGERPSSLFEWNNENEWYERLIFDSMICTEILKLEYKRK